MEPTPRVSQRPATQRYVTVSSVQRETISFDGRSANSTYWRGGAAYVAMCLTCGLEPVKAGRSSNCLCMCGLGKRGAGCSRALSGLGDEQGLCGSCGGGRPVIVPIGSVEVKAKRPRMTRVPDAGATVSDAVALTTTHAEVPTLPVAAVVAEQTLAAATLEAAQCCRCCRIARWATPNYDCPTYLSYGHFHSCSNW